MIILGFESSCDETGVAAVCTERGLLAHALHTQIAMHQEYGGVVPELASRDHIRRVTPLTRQVLEEAGIGMADVGAVAYTAGPGLAGALLVGASVAQALAWSRRLPAIGIHHLEGHLLSPMLADPRPEFPFVALLVSGGHTQLMRVDGVGRYELLGETLDDAAGEAFDKSAKLMGLGYPGGPALSKLAGSGDATRFELPRPMLHSGDLDFSFSGLKTAVLTRVKAAEQAGGLDEQTRADLAAATQAAIVEVLAAKSIRALKQTGLRRLVVAGGVGANQLLRAKLDAALKPLKARAYFPPLHLCTDNGAMIAFAAAERVKAGLAVLDPDAHSFTVKPRWDLADIAG
ncbi:tRNA (adenosine(37)-N6)-threonylcarbamoyltransferase complex transferase subunit TsaD [Achromobacter sp. Marseille-Q0513]|uniref:tRNA (adenosine(37)-N6)-threonylcarbamoyltransferase complex transferase subunit TsaD n=1 Tax=Achromobacter sp. Marseille-Q0513 TaxID=2829161 RepID=UPI001B991779|nr:tRNA (adenosine(37)-N6)-threonylcarbamoyltransferase complex transferase subunit TsaD [Achromobacter sp. Marseille-Q0513]MBR8654524.1 tRNA (adenosine(37)-N6)-threonylcarbamoyltransferase complex transferase subunit TsaD [Achromobacter sp. Marseille-Q0513]